MTNRLLVNPGTPQAWEIQLKSGQNRLGRGEQNDFKVNHPSVSGSHCEIVVSSAGVLLKDLGSTNGTYVNRAPVHEALLQTGQHLHLGGVEMLFEAVGRAAAPAPVTAPVAAPVTARITLPRPAASGLRISKPPADEPAPAEAKSPPLPPPLAPPVAPIAVGQAFCKFHQKTPARFLCNHCQKYFCDLCVTTRNVGGVAGKFCRACGAECVPVQVPVRRAAGPKGFFARLPGAFLYPFHGSGVLVLILGTLVLAAFNTATKYLVFFYGAFGVGMILGLILQALVAGYLFSYMQNIIHSTAAADEEMPPLPSMANFWEDVLLPSLRLFGLVLITFGPLIALDIWAVSSASEFSSPPQLVVRAIVPAAIFGCVYFPMAFLAVAMKDSVMAANPLVVVPSILKVPLEYLVIVIVLSTVFAIRYFGDMAVMVLFPRSFTTHSMPKLLLTFGVRAFWSFAQLYLLTVNVRILALLYVTKKDKLGWFSH